MTDCRSLRWKETYQGLLIKWDVESFGGSWIMEWAFCAFCRMEKYVFFFFFKDYAVYEGVEWKFSTRAFVAILLRVVYFYKVGEII